MCMARATNEKSARRLAEHVKESVGALSPCIAQIVPAARMMYARAKPYVFRTSRYLKRRLGPPIITYSQAAITIIEPPIRKSANKLRAKISENVQRVEFLSYLKRQPSSMTTTTTAGEDGIIKNEEGAKENIDGDKDDVEDQYRERFIPVTRKSIIKHLVQMENFLTREEKKNYESFAIALDTAIVNKYHGVLQDLKNLYDPINPDKDTIETRRWNPREREDNEFELMGKLDLVMEKANFYELPKDVIERALKEHTAMDGIRVSVDPSKYDILKFWALGREEITVTLPWYRQLFSKKETPPPIKYYKRVVVALRLKKDQKLMLKSFKEVPVGALEMMLPDGKIKIGKRDKGLLVVSVSSVVLGVLVKVVTLLANMNVDIVLIVIGIFGLGAVQSWKSYENKRNRYLAELNRILYFKNVANNRGLLALVVDRAEDESFKEALLVYTFLLANRPEATLDKRSLEMSPAELGGMTVNDLEAKIVSWVYEITKTKIELDSSEAIQLLKQFGILSEEDNKLYVLSLDAARRNLPQQPQSLVARATESDLSEGYDRDVFIETDEQYDRRAKREKAYGWF